jgi:hypothetical protein
MDAIGHRTIGITSIDEVARGFVSSSPIIKGKAKNGRPWIIFDIAAGKAMPEEGIFPTWRHCTVHGEAAENLRDIKRGDLVEVTGYLKTVAMRNADHSIMTETSGAVMRQFLLVSEKARMIPKVVYQQGRQLSLPTAQEIQDFRDIHDPYVAPSKEVVDLAKRASDIDAVPEPWFFGNPNIGPDFGIEPEVKT